MHGKMKPGYLVAFVVIVALVMAVGNMGMASAIYAVIIAALLCWLVPLGWKAGRKRLARTLSGRPSGLDHLMAPSGYRRARQAETDEEAAAQSIVTPTPNRPLYVDSDIEQMEDLQPKGALVQATDTRVTRYEKSGGRNLSLADGCNPPIEMVIGRAVLFLGIRGSGKTNGLARFLEQVFRFPLPALLCDYEEDYLSFPDVLTRCLIAGAPSWPGQRQCQRYWKVTARNAEEFGYSVMEYGVQVVLQIGTYETLEEAAQVMTGAIRGMFTWAEEQRPDTRVPALICLDEAQHFLPQDSSVSNIREEQARELLKAFMDVNARGRKRGLTPIIATQRPAQIRKEVIAGSEIYFLMKQTNPRDLDAYEALLGKNMVDRRAVASFQKGEGLVYEGGESWRIRFYERKSEHRGKTPTLTQALNRYGNGRPVPANIDFASRHTGGLTAGWEDDAPGAGDLPGFDDYEGDDAQNREEQGQALASSRAPARRNQEEQLIARAADAYLEGQDTQPKLSAALEVKLWDIRKLWPKILAEVERRELVEQE